LVARFVKFSGADPGRQEEAVEWVRDRVLPTLEAQDGFAGYIGLYDGERQMVAGITLWESREAAEAADGKIGGMRQETSEKFGLQVESAKLWEAPVVEIRTPVHA
jgi:hypothetical protein